MAVKAQLKYANFLLNFDFENAYEITGKQSLSKDAVRGDYGIILSDNNLFSITKLQYMGKIYRKGCIINYGYDEIEIDEALFGKIELIVEENGRIVFLLNKLKTLYKDDHFDAWKIASNPTNNYIMFELSNLENKRTYVINIILDQYFINAI